MNIDAVASRVALPPWTPGTPIAAIVRALADRGHRISLACESAEDDESLAGIARLRVYDSFRAGGGEFPVGFPRWAAAPARAEHAAVTISFTHRVSAQVWMPLDASARAWTSHALATRSPVSLGGGLARNLGLLVDLVRPRPPGAAPRRIVAIGAPSAEAARSAFPGLPAAHILQAPLTSTLPVMSDAAIRTLRARTRAAINLADDRLVVLISLMHTHGHFIDGLFGAIDDLNRAGAPTGEPAGPALIILCREPYRAHAAAARISDHCTRQVRVLGTTRSVAGAIAAADLCATCLPLTPDAFRSGSASRFAADSLRLGRPVLALTDSSGVAALGLAGTETAVPGMVVTTPSREDWTRALRRAADPAWLGPASEAARRLGPALDFDRLVEALEAALTDAAR